MPGIVAAALCVVALALAGCGRRYSVGPRDTVGDFELRLPAVVRRDLEGGLQVLAITGSPASVVVGVALRASDRADDPALEQLTFAALADEAERAAATRGALFAASQVDDGLTWYVQADAAEAAALLAEQAARVQAPTHAAERIAALHDEHRAVIDAWSVEPAQIARSYVRSKVYPPGHPYARAMIRRRDLARVDAAAIRGHHRAIVRPGAAAVVVVGGDAEALADAAAAAFAGWREEPVPGDSNVDSPVAPENARTSSDFAPMSIAGSGALLAAPPAPTGGGAAADAAGSRAGAAASPPGSTAPRRAGAASGPSPDAAPPLLLLEAPTLPQAILVLERATLARSDPDFVFLELGAAVLASVLHRRLREDRGLTYGVTATLDPRRGPSPLTIVTLIDRDRADEAVEALLGALADLQAAPVDAAVGDHLFPAQGIEAMLAVETGLGVATWAGRAFLFGDDPRGAEAELRRLQVRPEVEVNRVMAAHFRPERFTVAMVGDPARLQAALDRIGRPVERTTLAAARSALVE